MSCSGTATRPNALLAAKLLACSLLVSSQPAAASVHAALVVSALALLFNRRPRLASATLGAAVLVAAAFGGAAPAGEWAFLGLFLIAIGLERRGAEPRLGRAVIVLYYCAAAASRFAAPEWFFDRGLGEWTAAGEAALAAGFALPRLRSHAIWAGIFFHVGPAILAGVGQPTTFLFPLAAYLAAASWPAGPLLVIYDGDCGICNRCRRVFERFDFDRIYDWAPFQSGIGESFGIPLKALERSVHVVWGERVRTGFRAFQAMLLFNPLTYFVAAAAWTPPFVGVFGRGLSAAAAIALSFPLFNPVGEAAYAWVARNRRLFPGEGSCDLPPRDEP